MGTTVVPGAVRQTLTDQYERDVRHSEQRHAGRELFRSRSAVTAQQVGEQDQLEMVRVVSRVPLPPDAPRLARPERSRDETDDAEDGGDLPRRSRRPDPAAALVRNR